MPWSYDCMAFIVKCTEVRFASFLSGGITTKAVINQPERKLAKRTSVKWVVKNKIVNLYYLLILILIHGNIE